jgi:hypothetical protein
MNIYSRLVITTDPPLQRENGIAATLREAKGNETAEELEEERLREQHLIDTGMIVDMV